jgi:hypothetical protein
MLMFSFHLGPVEVFCLSHIPGPGEAYSTTYVKVGLRGRSLVENGQRAEAWDLQGEEACSAAGHAKVSGLLPGTEADVKSELFLGPVALRVDSDGEVRARLVPRRTIENESKVIEHWVVAR